MPSKATSYQRSGVDWDANTVWIRKIKSALTRTQDRRVLGRYGSFAGLFRLARAGGGRWRRPVLVGCADGVGTKVLLGIKTGRLRGLGVDLVAMNVNDLITCGAEPLFFLDYLAVHTLNPGALVKIIEGVADGCQEAGCALLGGETAEMPDLYRRGDVDLAGFCAGVVEEDQAVDGSTVSPGDTLIGLPSSGVHSNGFTLVRRLLAAGRLRLNAHRTELGESLADALMRPTKIYVRPVLAVCGDSRLRRSVRGMAHITGGGLPENVARAMGPRCDAVIETNRWDPPPIFGFLRSRGVAREEMFRVFNRGIGFVLVVQRGREEGVIECLARQRVHPVVIGTVRRGSGRVILR